MAPGNKSLICKPQQKGNYRNGSKMFVIAASDRYILNKICCSMSVAYVAAILKSAVFRFLKSHDKIRSHFKKT